VKDKRQDSLLYTLDRSIELFARTPIANATGAAAFETLKRARAMLVDALAEEAMPRRANAQVVEAHA
jgi:hypothetical protein